MTVMPRGMVLLSCVLFSSLLAVAGWQYLMLETRRQSVYVDVVSNSIVNRSNLLRAVATSLERWPNAEELTQWQAASGVTWRYHIVQPEPFKWRLRIARQQWLQRLIERHGGEGVAGYWQRTEAALQN